MKKDFVINISPTSFPNQLASDSEKETIEYGAQVGNAITYEWFWKGGTQGRYYDMVSAYRLLRLYARGEQPIEPYKNQVEVDGDASHLNLNWTPVPILPKFVDIVVNVALS